MAKFLTLEGLTYFYEKLKVKLNLKVDKADGKMLSTNDFGNSEKSKLAGISDNANNYAHPTNAGNKHVPTGGSTNQVLQYGGTSGTAVWGTAPGEENTITIVKVNGAALPITAKAVDIDLKDYAKKTDISTVYKIKGSKDKQTSLPTVGNVVGDVWNVLDSGANYVWTGTEWDKLSETVDLSNYLKITDLLSISNAEIDSLFA